MWLDAQVSAVLHLYWTLCYLQHAEWNRNSNRQNGMTPAIQFKVEGGHLTIITIPSVEVHMLTQ